MGSARRAILLHLLVFVTGFVVGQVNHADTAYAGKLYKEGFKVMGEGKALLAIPKFKQAAEIFQKNHAFDKAIKARLKCGIGMLYTDQMEEVLNWNRETRKIFQANQVKDEESRSAIEFQEGQYYYTKGQFPKAVEFFSKALEIAQNDPDSRPMVVPSLNGILGVCYLDMGEFFLAKDLIITSLEKNREILGEDHPYLATNYVNAATVMVKLGYYQKGLDYYKEGLRVVELAGSGTDPTLKSGLLNDIGECYLHMGELDRALDYYIQSLHDSEKSIGANNPLSAAMYANIGELLIQKGNFTEAREQLKKGIDICLHAKGNGFHNAKPLLLAMGKLEGSQGNHSASLNYFQQAIQIIKSIETAPYPGTILPLADMALIHAEMGNRDSAMAFISRASALCKSQWNGAGEISSQVELAWGKIESKLGRLDLAKKHFEAAKQAIQQDGNGSERGQNLDQLASDFNMMQACQSYADALLAAPRPQWDPELIQNGLENAEMGAELIENIESNGISNEFQSFLLESGARLFESGLMLALAKGPGATSPQDLDKAFQFSERAKASLLIASLQENQSQSYAGVPDTLIQQEKDLQRQLEYLRSTLANLKEGDEMAPVIRKKIIEVGEKGNAIRANIALNFPDYFRLKYHTPLPSTAEVQQWAKRKDRAVIEFFCGDSCAVVFAITGEKVQFHILPHSKAAMNRVQLLLDGVKSYNGQSMKSAWAAFEPLAKQVYQDWLGPLHGLLKDQQRWVVVPDGPFSQFPLEILIPTDAAIATGFKDADFLLRRHIIGYEFSAKNLLVSVQESGTRAAKHQVAAMAPTFPIEAKDATRGGEFALTALPFAHEEVNNILQFMEGESLLGNAASEEWLKANANDFEVLHLASHGIMDSDQPSRSRILLNPTEKEDGILFAYELFGMTLQSKLAVLSACNTGTGRYQRGEGMMSMARAFAFAGCPSILMSIWEVDDLSTSKLMEMFYAELAKGKDKDEALHNAKIAFLDQASGPQTHPFFWAGFIQTGDFTPIKDGNSTIWWVLGMLGIGIIGLIAWSESSKTID